MYTPTFPQVIGLAAILLIGSNSFPQPLAGKQGSQTIVVPKADSTPKARAFGVLERDLKARQDASVSGGADAPIESGSPSSTEQGPPAGMMEKFKNFKHKGQGGKHGPPGEAGDTTGTDTSGTDTTGTETTGTDTTGTDTTGTDTTSTDTTGTDTMGTDTTSTDTTGTDTAETTETTGAASASTSSADAKRR